MSRPLVFGNWKLNKTPDEAKSFVTAFKELVSSDEESLFAIFPPALCYTALQESLGASGVGHGLQNMAGEKSGAFTGENSGEVLKSLGGTHVLLGHSERRLIFSETDAHVAQKVKLAQALGLTPVVCVGEELPQRESGHTKEVICGQLAESLSQADYLKPLIVAYEPVWAIGTGKVATPEQADESHEWLKEKLVELSSVEQAEKIPLLYGGSVKPENSKELFAQKNIDGFLVGGASLDPQSFYNISLV